MHDTATAVAIKSGLIGMLSAYLLADAHLITIIIVGTLGGLINFFREVAHLKIKSTFPKIISEFFFTIPLGISLAVIVSEVGERYYPMKIGWIAVSLIVAMHSRTILAFLTPLIGNLVTSLNNALTNKIDKDKKDD